MDKRLNKTNKNSLKWLNGLSKGQRLNMVILILANSVSSILSVLFALTVKVILDGASNISDNGRNKILYGSIAIVTIIILQFVFRVITNGLTEHIKGKLEMSYKSHVFGEILSKRYSEITSYHSGELLNRLSNDVLVVSDGVTSILPTTVSAFVRLVFAVVALIILDPLFAIIFLLAGLFVGLIMGLMRGKLKSLHKEIQISDGKVRSFMQECVENVLSIKAFSAKSRMETKSNALQKDNFDAKMKRKNYSVVGTALYGFIYSSGYIFALIVGSLKIANGAEGFSYGSLLAVLQLVNNVQIPFTTLSSIFPKYYSMVASAERLMEIDKLKGENESKYLENADFYGKIKGIEIKNLSFVFDRDVIFDKADLFLEKNKFTVISGASGIGKSTLFKLILGVYDFDGEIFFDTGKEKINTSDSRKMFSFVCQGNSLFSGSIKDNITLLNSDYTNEQIERALKISCSDEFINTFPKGIDTIIGENGIGLSEGQSQRIAIARGILFDAPIMLLDEVSSALDIKTEEKLLKNLRELKNKTIVFISHKNKAVDICDSQYVLKDKTFIKKK